MGEEGPKGEMGEKVCKFHSLPFIVFVYVLEPLQRKQQNVWVRPENFFFLNRTFAI